MPLTRRMHFLWRACTATAAVFGCCRTPRLYGAGDAEPWGWGRNNSGQLGDGATAYVADPKQVLGIADEPGDNPFGGEIVKIVAGYEHTVLLLRDGRVKVSGLNSKGQLGLGDSVKYVTTAQELELPKKVTDIAAGFHHTLFLLSDETVWGCGWNAYGQVHASAENYVWTPIQIPGVEHAENVYAGYRYSMATVDVVANHKVVINNAVWGWGCNDAGQLGFASTDAERLRAPPGRASGLENVIKIACGGGFYYTYSEFGRESSWGRREVSGHTLFLIQVPDTEPQQYEVKGCGNNDYYALGQDGDPGGPGPVTIPVGGTVTDIACTTYDSLFLSDSGSVSVCGWQLGQDQRRPIPVQHLDGVRNIYAGSLYAVALLQDDTLWKWGLRDIIVLGSHHAGPETWVADPTPVPSVGDVDSVACGVYHTLAAPRRFRLVVGGSKGVCLGDGPDEDGTYWSGAHNYIPGTDVTVRYGPPGATQVPGFKGWLCLTEGIDIEDILVGGSKSSLEITVRMPNQPVMVGPEWEQHWLQLQDCTGPGGATEFFLYPGKRVKVIADAASPGDHVESWETHYPATGETVSPPVSPQTVKGFTVPVYSDVRVRPIYASWPVEYDHHLLITNGATSGVYAPGSRLTVQAKAPVHDPPIPMAFREWSGNEFPGYIHDTASEVTEIDMPHLSCTFHITAHFDVLAYEETAGNRRSRTPSRYVRGKAQDAVDGTSVHLGLPFTFPYFGRDYDVVWVSPQGYLELTAGDAVGGRLEVDDFPVSTDILTEHAIIAPLWDDLTVADGDVYIDDLHSEVAIRWRAHKVGSGVPVNVEAILADDGTIEFRYGSGNTGIRPRVALSAGDGPYVLAKYDGRTILANAEPLVFAPRPLTRYVLTVNSGSGSGEYPAHNMVEVVADDPPEGQEFLRWTGASEALVNPSDARTALTMPERDAAITATYTAAPSLVILTPFPGCTLFRETRLPVRWRSIDCTGNVRIELHSGSRAVLVLAASTENDGVFDWDIPAGVADGSDYTLSIALTADGAVSDQNLQPFTIATTPPAAVAVTSPNGGERFYEGTDCQINWTAVSVTGTVTLDLYKAGVFERALDSVSVFDHVYEWEIPAGLDSGNYTIQVTSDENAAVTDSSDAAFVIENTPPVLTLTSPVGGENWERGDREPISWTSANVTGNIRVELYRGSALDHVIFGETANDGEQEWDIPLSQVADDTYRIRLVALDHPGVYDDSDAAFSVTHGDVWTVGGTISGDVRGEVTVTVGQQGSHVSASSGSYSIHGVPPGAYVVTPQLSGYRFTPADRLITVTDADVEQLDFDASAHETADGAYLVIDISGGPLAAVYPYEELVSAPPDLLTNADYKTTKIVFRKIEHGTFLMGSPPTEYGRSAVTNGNDWEAQHQVTLTQDHYMGVFEVTQAQYENVCGSNPSDSDGLAADRPVDTVSWDDIRGGNWPGGDRAPRSSSFFGRLRSRTGLDCDLPTEAQWEYACRAGTVLAFNDHTRNDGRGAHCLASGDDPDENLDPLGWYKANVDQENDWNDPDHVVVGSRQPNLWGLYDMHGNVVEWCLDMNALYAGSPAVDPEGPLLDPGTCQRIMRGGSFELGGSYCRSASRSPPQYPDEQWNDFGFRAALPLGQSTVTYAIRGRVVGSVQGDVPIPLSNGRYALTQADGTYEIRGLHDGAYTVTPELGSGYIFTPDSIDVNVAGADVDDVDFTSTGSGGGAIFGTISGDIRAGVTVSLSSGRTAVTAADGSFVLSGLANGTYMIMPHDAGYRFYPPALNVTIDNSDAIRDFQGFSTGGDSDRYLVVDVSGGYNATAFPVSFRPDVPADLLTNDVYKTDMIVLRKVPAGTFVMGSPADEFGRGTDETEHQVTLTTAFYVGVFEVTSAQYLAVSDRYVTGSYVTADKEPARGVYWGDIRGGLWPNGNREPFTLSFVGVLRAKTRLRFDLPTEAQWEYACRAGSIRAYNDATANGGAGSDCLADGEGEADANLQPLAWFDQSQAMEVGLKQPNAWGLYDMHANVNEWCLDQYGAYTGDVTDPEGAVQSGTARRIVRGGNFRYDAPSRCRSAARSSCYENQRWEGFRFVLPQSPVTAAYAHAVRGTVNGAGAAGVTLTLNEERTTVTAGDGTFSFAGVLDGSYTVTPTKAGYTFLPTERVVAVSGGDVAGVDFTASGTPTHAIVIRSPEGGESWEQGSLQTISWSATGVGGDGRIELYNAGAFVSLIARNVPLAAGTYDWPIPDGQACSSACTVRVSSLDFPGVAGENATAFAITPPPPPAGITVTSPNGGEELAGGAAHTITWTSHGISGGVILTLLKGPPGFASVILESEERPDSGTATLSLVPETAVGSDYWIRVRSTADAQLFDESDAAFTVTTAGTAGASLTVLSPNGGEYWQQGTTQTVNWSSNGVAGALRVQAFKGGFLAATIAEDAADTGTFEWPVPAGFATGDDYSLAITSIDDETVRDASDAFFAIADGPPATGAITVTAPNGGETWETGRSEQVTWTSQNVVGSVKIEVIQGRATLCELTGVVDDGAAAINLGPAVTTGSGYRVRVSSEGAVPASDTSDAGFNVLGPSLSVTTPNGGETWERGRGYVINWTSDRADGEVAVELYRNGVLHTILTQRTDDDGSFNAVIPGSQTPSSRYRVRVRLAGFPSVYDDSDANLTITDPGVVAFTLDAPNGGEVWARGTQETVIWEPLGVTGNVKIELCRDGTPCALVSDDTANDGAFAWTVPANLTLGDNYTIRVTSLADTQVRDDSDAPFAVSTLNPPVLTVVAPNGGEIWQRGQSYDVTWTAADVAGMISLELYAGGGYVDLVTAAAPVNDGSFAWTIPADLVLGDNYSLRAVAAENNAVFDDSDNGFAVSAIEGAASIDLFAPAAGDGVFFDRPCDVRWESAAVTGNVDIQIYYDSAYTGVVYENMPNTGTFEWTPSQDDLDPGELYQVRVIGRDAPTPADLSDAHFLLGAYHEIAVDVFPGWNLLALPFALAGTPETIWTNDRHALLYAGSIWGWDPGLQDYEELTDGIASCRGFWLFGARGHTVKVMFGCRVPRGPWNLEEGWNLVGFTEDTAVADLGLGQLSIWHWDGTTYRSVTDTLVPGVGYWIFRPPAVR